jgi:hypothetical protein
MSSLNPLKWKPAHLVLLAALMAAGAAAGVLCGCAVDGWPLPGEAPLGFLNAFGWGLLGAVTFGGVGYGIRMAADE